VEDDAELTFGQRIEHMRRRRGLSRGTLASLLGYSEEWLRQVERKGRRVDRVSTLLRLAEVLQVNDPSTLIDSVVLRQRGSEWSGSGVVPTGVRGALLRWRVQGIGAARGTAAGALSRAELDDAWMLWRSSKHRYSAIQRQLITMLDRLGDDADDRLLRADTLRLASDFLLGVGDVHFAQVAVDHALAELATPGDSLGWYRCVGQFSEVLLRSGSHHESWKLASEAATDMIRRADSLPGDYRATLVDLHLIGAKAAAAMKDYQGAHASLDEAREVVARVAGTLFGSNIVDLAAVQVELVLGRCTQALRLAERIEELDALCLADQSEYYTTLARAHLTNNDVIATTFALTQTERICAEEVTFNAEARAVIAGALARNSTSVRSELSRLAERAGIL
jgi:DNA-binding XRE family transcriptional regulator